MDFTEHPFGLPSYVAQSDTINVILSTSYLYQKQSRLTNACATVNMILQQCLEAVSVDVVLKYGVLDLQYIKLPHVWLEYKNYVLDNTYVEDVEEREVVLIKSNPAVRYVDGVRTCSSVFTGDDETRGMGIDDHNIGQFKVHLQNPDRSLTLSCRNKIQTCQYFHKMRNFMKKEHGVVLKDYCDSEHDKNVCWSCGKEFVSTKELKRCSVCRVATYCHRDCQKKDWKNQHSLMCVKPN